MGAYVELNPQSWRKERNPYLSWVKGGKAAGQIADPAPRIASMARMLGLTPEQTVALLVERRTKLIDSLVRGELGDMYAKATKIEPLIGRANVKFTRPRLLPFGHPPAIDQAEAIHAAHEVSGSRRARILLVVNRPRWGGGGRMEGRLAHALAWTVDPADIVVVYADGTGGGSSPPGRFPDGVREIDFAGMMDGLEPEEQQAALVLLLRSFRADAIVNLNSATLYAAMQTRGRRWSRPSGCSCASSATNKCRSAHGPAGVCGSSTGSTKRSPVCSPTATSWRVSCTETYRVPTEHARPVAGLASTQSTRQPAPGFRITDSLRDADPRSSGRAVGSGRSVSGLLLEIAARMPDVDFRMWGEPGKWGRRTIGA